MSLVRFDNISKNFAGECILENINLRIEEGEHIGLIGRNGTGKSTIFRLITGETEPNGGLIERMRRARVACLAQLPQVAEGATIMDVVMATFAELIEQETCLRALEERMAAGDDSIFEEYGMLHDAFEARGGYTFRTTVRQVLQGLGFKPDEFDLPFHVLSGGQRTRLMLALVLLADADLLLLDEPENHLDLEAREWLETYLTTNPRAVVVISHDRQLLNAVARRIIEVERGQLYEYGGNYEYYVKQRALIREQQQKEFERQQDFIRKQEVFIERFRYKATKARAVQSRLKTLEKIERVEAPAPEKAEATFNLGEVVRSGAVVLDAHKLGKAYGPITLYKDVSFQVHRGERVGIIGPNGSGKTTLLRQLAGLLDDATGEAALGHKVTLGFYEQNHESINRANDILTEVRTVRPDMLPGKLRSFLGRLLFMGDDVFKSISALSGGELSRVAMAKLMLGDANLLLLDEPTNHLDIASREALEGALTDYPGAIVMASHDRALVDRLVTKLIIVRDGRAEVHLGNYAHYRWKHVQAEAEQQEKSAAEVLRIRRAQEQREKKKERDRETRKQQRKLDQVEADIEAMEALIAEFDAKFAAIDPSDYQRLRDMTEEYEGLKADLQDLYALWEEMAE